MNVKKVNIKKVKVIEYNTKTQDAKIEVTFENETPLTFNFKLQNNSKLIAQNIIKEIKQKKKENTIDFDDDILGTISLTHIQNDEELLFDHIFKGLNRLKSKVKNIMWSNKTNPTGYMDTLYALKNIKETLYRK